MSTESVSSELGSPSSLFSEPTTRDTFLGSETPVSVSGRRQSCESVCVSCLIFFSMQVATAQTSPLSSDAEEIKQALDAGLSESIINEEMAMEKQSDQEKEALLKAEV